MTIALPRSMFECRDATVAARARTGDRTIGTRVAQGGAIQVVRVVYPKKGGYATVTPLSEYLPAREAIAFLNAL